MRKNPMVRIGRPPRAKMGPPGGVLGAPPPSPMAGFDGAMPAAGFNRGGKVPAFHDDARMAKSHGEHGFASADAHTKRLCHGGKV